jgi:hypothetical protein
VAKLPPLCHFNLLQISTVKLYLCSISSSRSSFFQCTTCGPPSSPRLKCTPDAATSLQSNAHTADGRSDAAASNENSAVLDLDGAMTIDVMRCEGVGDSNVGVERDGCGDFGGQMQVQEGVQHRLEGVESHVS